MEEVVKKLYRSNKDYIITGVCGGLGEYFGIDTTIIRLLMIILMISHGAGLVVYIALALILPKGGEIKAIKEGKEEVVLEKRSGMLGWIVVISGVYLLINQVAPGWLRLDLFWPMVVILSGVYLLVRK